MRHLAKWAAEVRIGSWSCENVENGAAGYQVVVVVALGSARGRNRFATDSPLERAGFELPVPRGVRSDSPLEGGGFELVWGFSCQVVLFGLLPVLCSEREGPFFTPSPAIRVPECTRRDDEPRGGLSLRSSGV